MTKAEFLSKQKEAEYAIREKGKFIPWLSLMITIAMVAGIGMLAGFFRWTVYNGDPAYGLLWEIAFCLLVLCITSYEHRYSGQKTVALLKKLGLTCPICDRSSIFDNGKITAKTGQCSHCDHSFFDPAS